MSLEAELAELRRRRRIRRISVASACVVVLILGGLWLNTRHSTMTCSDWQAEYVDAAMHDITYGSGTKVNLEKVRPEGCSIPAVPGG